MSVGGVIWYREEGTGSFLSPISFFLSSPLGLGWPSLLQQRSLRHVLFSNLTFNTSNSKISFDSRSIPVPQATGNNQYPVSILGQLAATCSWKGTGTKWPFGRGRRGHCRMETELQELLIQDHILLPVPCCQWRTRRLQGLLTKGQLMAAHTENVQLAAGRRGGHQVKTTSKDLPKVTKGEVSTNSFLIPFCKEVSGTTKVTKGWGQKEFSDHS